MLTNHTTEQMHYSRS